MVNVVDAPVSTARESIPVPRRPLLDPRRMKPYLLAGDLFLFAGLLLTFSVFRLGPTFSVLVGAVGVGVALIAPMSETRRVHVSLPLVALISWLMATYFWTTNPERFRTEILALLPLTCGAVIVGSLVPIERIVRSLLAALAAGVGLQYLALLTNTSEATSSTAGHTSEVVRGWDGTFDHKNGLAVFTIFTFISFLVLGRPGRLRMAVLVACIPLLIGSQSSTGMSCFVVVLLAAAWLNLYLRQREHFTGAYLALSGLAFVALLLFLATILPTIVNLYGKDLTFSGRTKIWSAVVPAIHEHPFKGYGFGNVFFDHATEPTASIDRRAGFVAWHAHNSALQMLLEAGLIGLLAYLVFFWSTVATAWRSLTTRPDVAKLVLLFATMQLVVGLSEVALLGGWIFVLVVLRGALATVTRNNPDATARQVTSRRRRAELFAAATST